MSARSSKVHHKRDAVAEVGGENVPSFQRVSKEALPQLEQGK